ncbi:MAG: hypothetical protein Q9192_002285 [Flavoplaca navasiana]
MARTRAQGRQITTGHPATQKSSSNIAGKKRSRDEVDDDNTNKPSRGASKSDTKKAKALDESMQRTVNKMLTSYGSLPLSDLGLPNPSSANPENVLALVLNAMLTSARISHELAFKSVKCLIEAGYQDIKTLTRSTWEERTDVLTSGGYTRYREKTSTALGDLAQLVVEKYNGDLNHLLSKASSDPTRIRQLIKEIKGIGNVGVDIFFNTAQSIWPCLAPFIDPRSMKTAKQCGIGDDVRAIWRTIEEDSENMCRLANALTKENSLEYTGILDSTIHLDRIASGSEGPEINWTADLHLKIVTDDFSISSANLLDEKAVLVIDKMAFCYVDGFCTANSSDINIFNETNESVDRSGIMDSIKQTVAQNLGGAAHQAVSESQQFALEQVPSLTGKVAVITGGSQGIGYGCSHTMLTNDIKKLFILSMSKEVVDGAVNAVKEEMGQESADKMVWLQCDLSDWKQVKETADKIASSTDRIDIMINNAARGIMTYQTTEYGVDRHMALNHMGHVILNSHLLPIMKKTASEGNQVRIAILASNAHQGAPSDCKFESLDELNQDLGPNGQYGRSKLANILYARYLARHLTQSHPNILANATHPGFVDTKMSTQDIHEPYPLGGYAMSVGMAPIKKNIWMGCVSTMFAATKTPKSGEYICPPAIPESGTDLAQNEELGEKLMKLTRDVIKEKTYADSAAKGCPFQDY